MPPKKPKAPKRTAAQLARLRQFEQMQRAFKRVQIRVNQVTINKAVQKDRANISAILKSHIDIRNIHQELNHYFRTTSPQIWKAALKQVWLDAGAASIELHHAFFTGQSAAATKSYLDELDEEPEDEWAPLPQFDFFTKAADPPDSWANSVDDYLRGNGAGRADGISSTTGDQVLNAIADGVAAKEGTADIAARVEDQLDTTWPGRADTIARTETAAATNQASLEDAQSTVPGMQKVWLCSFVNSREWHEDADQQTCDLSDPFSVMDEDLDYPGDPSGSPENVINCFDGDTGVLTDTGFIQIKDATFESNIATLNPDTFEIEYMHPKYLIQQQYIGDLIAIKSKSTDILVTPDHRIPVIDRYQHYYKNEDVVMFRTAESLQNQDVFIRCGARWKGKHSESVQINGKEYPAKLFMEFMGWYLSEGWAQKRSETSYQIYIAQKKGSNHNRIRDICTTLGFNLHNNNTRDWISFYDASLGEYLSSCGKHANEKHIPYELKQLAPELLKIFLNAYIAGDGWYDTTGRRGIKTTSLQMADDLCELILKTGKATSFNTKTETTYFKNRSDGCITTAYTIKENTGQGCYRLRHKSLVDYDGFVYCVTMPHNHIIYTRRNGKCVWLGQCMCSIGYTNAAGEEVSEGEAEGEAEEGAAPELSDQQTSALADMFDTLASGSGELTHDEAATMSDGIDDILTPEEEAEEATPKPVTGRKPVVPPSAPPEEEPEEVERE